MKKSILVLIAVFAIGFSSFGQTAMEYRYNLCYAYSYKHNTLYISKVISERFKKNHEIIDRLKNQWTSKVSAIIGEEYYDYTMDTYAWLDDVIEIERIRNEMILQYKKENFNIIYVTDFTYYKK